MNSAHQLCLLESCQCWKVDTWLCWEVRHITSKRQGLTCVRLWCRARLLSGIFSEMLSTLKATSLNFAFQITPLLLVLLGKPFEYLNQSFRRRGGVVVSTVASQQEGCQFNPRCGSVHVLPVSAWVLSGCECEREWLPVSLCQLCDSLATCPGCTLPLAQCQLRQALVLSQFKLT